MAVKFRNYLWRRSILLTWSVTVSLTPWCVFGAVSPSNPDSPKATDSKATDSEVFGSDRARAALSSFRSRGTVSDPTIRPKSPQETIAAFKVMAGLEIDVVLHEPLITQPLSLSFDERGRLWVVQYIQYPYPAGLKVVDLGDQFHATYDKIPAPPPHHHRGADRISIHEDTDGDGLYDVHKVFLDGLNLATAVARGRGGVWVLNPPYLLFYPDANSDDIPDGDPMVHLAGFGLQDTHSVANSLRWGPDGWLWGAQGSGVDSTVVRPGIDTGGHPFKGQAIWRYHPLRREFELFAQGGGNTFSLLIDTKGRVFSGTNNGGVRGLHYQQGAFYKKNWGEHGYLSNPYAFGYFEAMPHNWEAPRFSQALLYYEDGELGEAREGHFMAPNALRNRVELTARIPNGSSYRTEDVATLLETDDRWFRPVDIEVGPDGAVYLADWYDTRLTHMDPRDNWDRQHGRVYRIRAAGSATGQTPFDLTKKTSGELVGLLAHRRSWFRSTALRLLADRGDRSVMDELNQRAHDPKNPYALDALWGLHAVGGFSLDRATNFLQHPQEAVRMWAVRLIGDRPQPIPPALKAALEKMTAVEPAPQVRSQLAATAQRLPAEVALPIVFGLINRAEDVDDPHIPLLLWWALERFIETHRGEIVKRFSGLDAWQSPMMRTHILHRIARRYASLPSTENQQTLARLAKSAPDEGRTQLRKGITEAFEGRGLADLSSELESILLGGASHDSSDPVQLSLAIKRGDRGAIFSALGFIVREDPQLTPDRIRVIEALADTKAMAARPVLIEILARSREVLVREAALAALGAYDDGQLVTDILRLWADLEPAIRQRALTLLVRRPSWAQELLSKVARNGVIPKSDIPDDIVGLARLLNHPEVTSLADRYFGKAKTATSIEKQQRIEELTKLLAIGGAANPVSGKALFAARCASCHKLFGQGGELGPDLTSYERGNIQSLLLGVVDPSAGILDGYALSQIKTKDDRLLVGFIVERDANRLVLRDPAGQRTSIAVASITSEKLMSTSLMPEGLLDGLSAQEVRDLFGYLASKEPTAVAPAK